MKDNGILLVEWGKLTNPIIIAHSTFSLNSTTKDKWIWTIDFEEVGKFKNKIDHEEGLVKLQTGLFNISNKVVYNVDLALFTLNW